MLRAAHRMARSKGVPRPFDPRGVLVELPERGQTAKGEAADP
jgi:hypothetical protein